MTLKNEKWQTVRNSAALLLTASALTAPAMAQSAFDGTYIGPTTSTTVVGTSTTETTGNSSIPPYQNTITTYTNETVTSSTASTTPIGIVVNGVTYTGQVDFSGSGEQEQIHETSLTNTYDPGPPPTVLSTIINPDVITPGASSITAVSVNGAVGSADNYAATLQSSGPVNTNGTVLATENAVTSTTTGVVYTQRNGTATYDPGAGEITVSLPTAPDHSTSITALGITTTGTISATGFNANGGRLTQIGDAIAISDGVNLGQVNSIVAASNTELRNVITTSHKQLQDQIDKNRRRADAGTATAVALSGGTFLPNKKLNFTVNLGGYRGETAIAGQVNYLISENVAVNAGVAQSFSSHGGTAWRGGMSIGF